jgi:hypothetical protein
VRSGEIKLVTVTSGPQAGEVHLNGVIAGFIEYIPDDTSLPTYSGTYSEKLNGVLLELTFDDDQERISQFRLRSQLVGTDGSSLRLAMLGKLTLNGNGTSLSTGSTSPASEATAIPENRAEAGPKSGPATTHTAAFGNDRRKCHIGNRSPTSP